MKPEKEQALKRIRDLALRRKVRAALLVLGDSPDWTACDTCQAAQRVFRHRGLKLACLVGGGTPTARRAARRSAT